MPSLKESKEIKKQKEISITIANSVRKNRIYCSQQLQIYADLALEFNHK